MRPHRCSLVVLALVATLFVPAPAGASTPTLTRTVEYLRGASGNHTDTIDQAMSSPAIGDVTGDGRADVVVGGMDGVVTVLDPTDGTVLRAVTPQRGAAIQASPVLVDVTGDGVRDVVAATVGNSLGRSHVIAYDMVPSGGKVVFDQMDSGRESKSGIFGLAVGDIDADGAPEIVATALDHRVHAWNLDGSVVRGFPAFIYDTSLSAPALADVDRDGALDIVFGGDMDGNQPLPPGGYLWALRGDGNAFPGYPLHLSDEVLWSSPAVADIDADGDLDAVIGTGRNFNNVAQRNIYAVDLNARAFVPGWPRTLSGATMASPALADLDGDGRFEVVTATGDGNVHRLEHDGTPTWTTCANATWLDCNRDYGIIASPVIADVDDDAAPEVIIAENRELLVLSSSTGAIETRVTIRSNSDRDFAWPAANAPAVGVRDGRTYIAVEVQVDDGDNQRVGGDIQGTYVWSAPGTPSSAPWAQFRRNAGRLGAIDNGAPVTNLFHYVDALYVDLLGRHATADEQSRGVTLLHYNFSRYQYTRSLARTPEWIGGVIDDLYRQVFGRPADPGGRAYWTDQVARGLRVSEVAAHFYGSDEWYARPGPTGGGNSPQTFVRNLYRRILGREPDSAASYWIESVKAGTDRTTVARGFYLSLESNRRRVRTLYQQLLDRRAEPEGLKFWSHYLVEVDDIYLAAQLTASDEYLRHHS